MKKIKRHKKYFTYSELAKHYGTYRQRIRETLGGCELRSLDKAISGIKRLEKVFPEKYRRKE